jgi:cephalosporin hydroxylase
MKRGSLPKRARRRIDAYRRLHSPPARQLTDPWPGSSDIRASLIAVSRQNALPGVVKTVEDLVRYARIIERVHPDLVIETGTNTGASACFFAAFGCNVLTIDIDDDVRYVDRRVEYVSGSSTDPQVIAHTRRRASDARTVMISLDSDHSRAHVAAEIRAYAPIVTPGSYLVIEDGIAAYLPGYAELGSPLDAIEAFLTSEAGADFELDQDLEAMFPVTMFTLGWLWRRP